jgi:serine/threonine-protein kinase
VNAQLEQLRAAVSSRYVIERELGAGGMAKVYLAHDVKHDRDVAIKVLNPELSQSLGSDRFLSEIRTTARLQHPHILPLLDSDATDGLLYYVMPLVGGETLRARLAREKQLPIEDALLIAREVADALNHAHAHGVVHRDIKPENILLQDGHALVADFGIALALESAGGQRVTQTGISLGTPHYMSPEQGMGERAIDARTDIYSLGVVTYEMLTGQPPFTGATAQAILGKVLTEKPAPPSGVRDTVAPHVEHAVLKALAKLPADRWATASKFAEALTRTDLPHTSGERHAGIGFRDASTQVHGTHAASRRALVVGGLAAALLLPGAWWLGRRSNTPAAPWAAFTQLTDASGMETSPSLSPDGESFVYASNTNGTWDIFVQRVGGRNPVLVAGDSIVDEVWPAYSPDGKQIAFNRRGDGIFIVGATGESPRRLTSFGSNPAWSPDGKRIAFGFEEVISPYDTRGRGAVWTVEAAGGEPKQLTLNPTTNAYQPAWSPSGRRIAYWTNVNGRRDLETVADTGGERTKVTGDAPADWAPVWSPDGRFLYFASDRGGAMGIWRIAVDAATGRVEGTPEPIVSGVDVAMDLPRLSKDGTTLIFRSISEAVNPAAIEFDPVSLRAGAVTMLQRRTGILIPSDVSPDGKILTMVNSPDRQQDVFTMAATGGPLTRVTDDEARDWSPRFTPDGNSITFHSNFAGQYDAWMIRLDGSGRTRLTTALGDGYFPMFAPDGRRLMAARRPSGAIIGTGPWPLTKEHRTDLGDMRVGDGVLEATSWSRDGRWLTGRIVMASGESRGNALYEVATGKTRQLSNDVNTAAMAWLPGYQRVMYFNTRGTLFVQDIESLQRREIKASLPYPPDQSRSIAISPDGRTLYYGAYQVGANVWMVKQSPAESKKP